MRQRCPGGPVSMPSIARSTLCSSTRSSCRSCICRTSTRSAIACARGTVRLFCRRAPSILRTSGSNDAGDLASDQRRARARPRSERRGALGSPQASEPGYGAEPHLKMTLRARLFVLVAGAIAATVVLVTWTVSTSARRSFAALDAQPTAALVAQFRRAFAAEGDQVALRMDRIAASEPVARLAADIAR